MSNKNAHLTECTQGFYCYRLTLFHVTGGLQYLMLVNISKRLCK